MAYCDVLVIGAGAVGLAVAHEAARRGYEVILVDAKEPGSSATTAASGGLLAPGDLASWHGDHRALIGQALQLWPEFARTVSADAAMTLHHRTTGLLNVAYTEPFVAAHAAQRTRIDELQTAAAEQKISFEAALSYVPDSSAAERAVAAGESALAAGRAAVVDTSELPRVLLAACQRHKVRTRFGVQPQTITWDKDGSVQAVSLRGGLRVECDHLVIATGAATGALEWITASQRLPISGQIADSVLLQAAPTTPLTQRPVVLDGITVLPLDNHRFWVGGHRRDLTDKPDLTTPLAAVHHLIGQVLERIPASADASMLTAASATCAVIPDGLPVAGPDDTGVLYAVGHGHDGLLFTPLIAQLTVDAIDWLGRGGDSADGEPERHPWDPFSPRRLVAGD